MEVRDLAGGHERALRVEEAHERSQLRPGSSTVASWANRRRSCESWAERNANAVNSARGGTSTSAGATVQAVTTRLWEQHCEREVEHAVDGDAQAPARARARAA